MHNPLVFIDACLWSFLHFLVLNIPPARLPVFPVLAGLVWLVTLSTLLLSWVAHGMPHYPGQEHPIAFVSLAGAWFISDIASFELKPLFLVGSSLTAVCFAITIAAVHVMRYEPGFALLNNQRHDHRYERDCEQLWCSRDGNENNDDNENENDEEDDDDDDDNNNSNSNRNNTTNNNDQRSTTGDDTDEEDLNTTKTLRLISLLSVLAAVTASTALILLSILDTVRHRTLHQLFLQICFSGLAVQAAGTAVVYANEVLGFVLYLWNRGQWLHDWGGRSVTVRIFVSLSTALILVEIFLCVTFLAVTGAGQATTYPRAAILEWVIAFLGAIYLFVFGGFFLDRTDSQLPKPFPRGEMHGPDPERRPLLGNDNDNSNNTPHGSYTEV